MTTFDDDAVRRLVEENPGQATFEEYTWVRDAVLERAPSRMLVFGVGRDAALWLAANQGGETHFVEDSPHWADAARRLYPHAPIHLVTYRTLRAFWRIVAAYPARFALEGLPDEVTRRPWDVVLIDGPRGTRWYTPGRALSILTASRLAAPGADLFVHDCHRPIEDQCADRFLGATYRVGQVGSMRRYTRP